MNKFLLLSLLSIFLSAKISFAQNDTIYFHNGNVVAGKVVSVSEYTITYKYSNEDAQQTASKYAIEKIHYQSGRNENITSKIIVNGVEDWEKVMVLDDKSQIAGLTRGNAIRSYTKFLNLHTANTGEKKAYQMLLKEAATFNQPFIFITFERATLYNGVIKGLGALQEIKRAVAFGY